MALSNALRQLRIPASPGEMTLSGLFERWHKALTACLPEPLRRALIRRDRHLTLALQGKDAILYREAGSTREMLGKIDTHISNAALDALLTETRKGNQRRILIELPGNEVISRTVSFPAQVRKNLAQVIAYEIDRLTPFHSDQVYFTFRPLEIQPKSEKQVVQIALCRKDAIQDWIKHFQRTGTSVDQVMWEGCWPNANLLPITERSKRGGYLFNTNMMLSLLVLCLVMAALASPIWQNNQKARLIESELSEVKKEAQQVDELRDAIERARQGSVAVLERKSDQLRMIDLLRELTDRLPDDTWIQNLDYRDGEIQIRGESKQATNLIGVLEKVSGFSNVAFRSPVVQVRSTGSERFHIAFTYVLENRE